MRPCSSVLIFLHWVLFPVTSRALFSTRQSATLHRTISSASRTLPEIVAIDRIGRSSCHEALYLSAKEGGEPQDQEITDLNLEQMFEVFEAADSAVPATEGGMKTTEIEGYLNMDMGQMGQEKDGKQLRVLLYITFALLPCLLLVPFMMQRDFLPAVTDL